MKQPTRAQLESTFGPVNENFYSLVCGFIQAVNAEHKANPHKTEAECYRDLLKWFESRYETALEEVQG